LGHDPDSIEEERDMRSKAILTIAAALLIACSACSTKTFPAGAYIPAQPSPTDRITEFSFADDGTFTISYYDGKQATGTYTASGDEITLNELNEDSPCIGSPATMTWASSGDRLTFKTLEDACSAGPSYDWAREWTRQP
jgi:hypothetical protein